MSISKPNMTSIVTRINNVSDNSQLTGTDDDVVTAKIEVSSICNFHCKFCFSKSMPDDRKGLMNKEELELSVQALKSRYKNLKEIGLFYMGESGFNPFLKDMYKYLKDQGFFTYLTTNGSHIEKILEAIPYIDSLKVSWNYSRPEDFVYKTNQYIDEYNVIIGNITKLYDECHKYNKKLYISTVLGSEDPNVYNNALSQLKYDEHYWIPLQNQGGYNKDGKDGVVGTSVLQRNPIPCWSLFKGVYVDRNLNIRPCCYGHKKTSGSIKPDGTIEFNSLEEEMKKEQLQGIIPEYCKNCLRSQLSK